MMMDLLADLRCTVIHFSLSPIGHICLGDDMMKGDKWRGGFGEALRNIECFYRWDKTECRDCDLQDRCFFFLYFGIDIPHPFVMRPALDSRKIYKPDNGIALDLVLIGEPGMFLDRYVRAIEYLGRIGIGSKSSGGKRGGKYVIRTATVGETVSFGEFCASANQEYKGLNLELLTPLNVEEKDHDYRDKLPFRALIKGLLRRLVMMNHLYGSGTTPATLMQAVKKKTHNNLDNLLDDRVVQARDALLHLADSVQTLSFSAQWYDGDRYSSRQGKRLKMGGLRGGIQYAGNLAPFYPYLKMGEIVGVGTYTTSGFGRYALHEATSPPEKFRRT